jgi:hypothetical protein
VIGDLENLLHLGRTLIRAWWKRLCGLEVALAGKGSFAALRMTISIMGRREGTDRSGGEGFGFYGFFGLLAFLGEFAEREALVSG